MTTKKKCFDLAFNLLGSSFSTSEDSGFGGWSIDFWSPVGFIFDATGCHTIVAHGTKPECWQSLYDDLQLGISECETIDCDTCNQY